MKKISSFITFLFLLPSLSGACEPGSNSYYSNRQFLSAVNFAAIGVDPESEVWPQATHVADITGDGLEDLIVGPKLNCDTPDYPIRVLVNNGSGSLIDETDTLFATPVRAMAMVRQYFVADFNNDGFPDLFLSTTGRECELPWTGEQNVLYLSDGLGQLHDATTNLPQISDFSHGSSVGDFSGDSIPDIYVNNLSDPPYNLLLNDGGGNFTVVNDRLEHLCDGDPCSDWWGHFWSQFIDANGDGFLDLFLNNGQIDPVGENFPHRPAKLVLNDGTGHFGDPVESAIPPRLFGDKSISHQSLVADLNGDGLDDLVVDENENQTERIVLRIFISNGNGTFSDETDQRLPGQLTEFEGTGAIYARDYDRDGVVDLLSHKNHITTNFLINDGSGVMRELPQDVPCVDLFWAPVDIDGDNGVDYIHNDNIDNLGPWYYLVKSLQAYGPVLDGTLEDDRLIGGAQDNIYRGLAGNDVLDGGLGDDDLDGGAGDDELVGSKGNDKLTGGEGDDRMIPGPGADAIDGGEGSDTVEYDFPIEGVELLYDRVTFIRNGDGSINDQVENTEYALFNGSATPLPTDHQSAIASLNGVAGLWFDPAFDGEGFNVITTPSGTVLFFYGYTASGQRLWLISETLTDGFAFEQVLDLQMFEGQGGTFDQPAASSDALSEWGRLKGLFDACGTGRFALHGKDGVKTTYQIKLAGITNADCDTQALSAPSGLAGLWYDPLLDGEGYNIIITETSTVFFFYGYDSNGQRLWLISETLAGAPLIGQTVILKMFAAIGGTFDEPAPSSEALTEWGELEVMFSQCSEALANLTGADGHKTSNLTKLAGIDNSTCP